MGSFTPLTLYFACLPSCCRLHPLFQNGSLLELKFSNLCRLNERPISTTFWHSCLCGVGLQRSFSQTMFSQGYFYTSPFPYFTTSVCYTYILLHMPIDHPYMLLLLLMMILPSTPLIFPLKLLPTMLLLHSFTHTLHHIRIDIRMVPWSVAIAMHML